MQTLTTDVLVVGGGTGGTAAAIQAARRGANIILVSEFPWLGGMLTSAGVTAPDGNELSAWQTGLWGAFLRELEQRQPGGLDNAWVSFFTYEPAIGAQIFADWVAAWPNLKWLPNQRPLEVLKQGDRITGVRFESYTITAQIILDGTELGDLLALGNIPHRWGWELQSEFGEPSAPVAPNRLTQQYPVQAPTWVVVLQDYGAGNLAPAIPPPPNYQPDKFRDAWKDHGAEAFLNYGRLPGDRFMINWPIHGNDYGEGSDRLIGTPEEKAQFHQAALWHTQGFAHFIQTHLGRRYGLAANIFPAPTVNSQLSTLNSPYALHPYYRESRRLKGLATVRESDILPDGQVAPLPIAVSAAGGLNVENCCQAIAIGNYANDHHYPSGDISLQPKSRQWGGRWTGTPFTIPYGSLVPATIDGFLVCEKNISVSHIANGATRLQPLVLGIGQAAGLAAALCIEQGCQPRELAVRSLQTALLHDPTAPAALIPLFNLPPQHPDWLYWQNYYLDHPEAYPTQGDCPLQPSPLHPSPFTLHTGTLHTGTFIRNDDQDYSLIESSAKIWKLVTIFTDINQQLQHYQSGQKIILLANANWAGKWLVVAEIRS
jgi:hypothetical protein